MKDKKIVWIDGWNVILALNAVSFITDASSAPIGVYLGVLNQIRTFVEKFKPTKVFFILDGPEAGERRRKLYPNYKGKRRVTGRESKVQIMEGEDNIIYGDEGGFQNQLIKIYEFLKFLPITVCSVPYCEADDMIAYLALKNKNEYDNIIISNDRDYLQLVQEGIMVYRWRMKKLYDEQAIIDEFKILPKHFIFRKVLLGDASDLIEGIDGIGKKTFENLSSVFLDEKNNFEDIGQLVEFFEHLNTDEYKTREKNAIKKILQPDNLSKMLVLYQIMKLDEDCMKLNQREILRTQIIEQEDKVFSRLSAKLKMQRTCFNKLYNGFNDEKWLQPFAFLRSGIKVNA